MAVAFAVAAISQPNSLPVACRPTNMSIARPRLLPPIFRFCPKTMTGEQVHEMMHKWEAALGTECSTCHAADPKEPGPNGRPGSISPTTPSLRKPRRA